MQKYNDFALPTLENIEQMAKAYQNKGDKQSDITSMECLQVIYDNVYCLCLVADFLYTKYGKNAYVVKLFNKCKSIKLNIDGVVLDKNIKFNKDYTVSENTILQDSVNFALNIIKCSLQNGQNDMLKSFAFDVCDVLEALCSY